MTLEKLKDTFCAEDFEFKAFLPCTAMQLIQGRAFLHLANRINVRSCIWQILTRGAAESVWLDPLNSDCSNAAAVWHLRSSRSIFYKELNSGFLLPSAATSNSKEDLPVWTITLQKIPLLNWQEEISRSMLIILEVDCLQCNSFKVKSKWNSGIWLPGTHSR